MNKHMTVIVMSVLYSSLLIVSFLFVTPTPAPAITINVTYGDGAGEGFNDPTLGAARKTAFEYALNIWGGLIGGTVIVSVTAEFNPLGGSAGSAVLGQAGAFYVHRDFTGAPLSGTYYTDALADQLHGSNLGGSFDIRARFNSDVDDPVVLGSTNWYYGTDGNPGGHIDFVSVVLHEICHGLNFTTLVNSSGQWLNNFPDVYGRLLAQPAASPPDFLSMTNPQRAAAIISDNLYFTGAFTTAANGGGNARMYAPTTYQSGSSVSHFDISFSPNELMEPSYTGANHSVGLALPLLQDLGWQLLPVERWGDY